MMIRESRRSPNRRKGQPNHGHCMLTFHQEETCEGIIRHLEIREGQTRRDVRVRDIGNQTPAHARVEMTFWLGEQLYAMEHTGFEPFERFMEHQNRASALFAPLETE